MKLSELVAYRQSLEELIPDNTEEVTKKILGPSLYAVQSHPSQISYKVLELESKYQSVDDAFHGYLDLLNEIKTNLERLILDLEPSYLVESYKLYESMCNDSVEHILNRRFVMTERIENFVHGRVQQFSHWKHGGMIIRPGLEPWIDSLVASDPLYIVDTNYDLLKPVKQRFSEQYIHRVRWNVINELLDHPLLADIPDGQIGFCLCYNFFHFKPFEIMRQYLSEIYDKLKPGGTLAMTFNDCDRRGAVDNAERYYMCYTPGRMVRSLCDNIGFEITYSYDLDAAATWLELRKPGTLTSLRGGQTLAKINSIHNR